MPLPQQNQKSFHEIDFTHYISHYFNLVWRWKIWIIIAGPVFFIATFVGLLKFYPENPELTANTLIGLENAADMVAVRDVVSTDDGKAAIIKTRTFLQQIVHKLSLRLLTKKYTRSQLFDDVTVDSSAVSGKYHFKINKENNNLFILEFTNKKLGIRNRIIESNYLASLQQITTQGITLQFSENFLQEPHDFTFNIVDERQAIEYVYERLEIKSPDPRRQIFHIEVTLRGKDYPLMAQTLNTIADAFVEKNMLYKRRKNENLLAALEKQFEKAKVELAKADAVLNEFRTENPTVGLNQTAQQTVQELIAMETSTFSINNDLKDGQKLYTKFASAAQEEKVQVAQEIIYFLSLKEETAGPILQNELDRLIAEKRDLLRNYIHSHPLVKENQNAINNVLEKINQALSTYLANTEKAISRKASGINSLSNKLKNLPNKEIQLAELTRRQQVAADIYSTVLDRYNQAKVAETIEVADVYIMDYAVPPIPPPVNTMKFLAISVLLGAAIALGPMIVADMATKTVRTEFELNKMTDLVVLESVPEIKVKKRRIKRKK